MTTETVQGNAAVEPIEQGPADDARTRTLARAARDSLRSGHRLMTRAWPWVRRFGRGIWAAVLADWTLRGPTVLTMPGPRHRRWAIRGIAIVLVVALMIESALEIAAGPMMGRPAVALLAPPLMTLPLLLLPAGPLIAWRLSSLGAIICLAAPGQGDYIAWPVSWTITYPLLTVFAASRLRGNVTAGMWFAVSACATLGGIGYVSTFDEAAAGAFVLAAAMGPLCLGGFAWHAVHQARADTSASTAVVAKGEERQAVLLERARIARELHDIVTHHMSAIAVQAQAAQLGDPALPDGARAALASIETTARQSLTDLRAAIGVLREDGTSEPRAPRPTLEQLPDLIGHARTSGQQIDYAIELHGPLPERLSITAYRIVQEALTNALRHAPAERATITVRSAGGVLDICVRNPIAQEGRTGPVGHGLRGMRERVEALGGELRTGANDGEFLLSASLPAPAEAAR